MMPLGTVSLTTYFHIDVNYLAAEDINRVLRSPTLRSSKSYGDQFLSY